MRMIEEPFDLGKIAFYIELTEYIYEQATTA
jgi:hypothetical protein